MSRITLCAVARMLQKACGCRLTIRAHLLSDTLPVVHGQWVGQVGPPILLYYLSVLIVRTLAEIV